MLGRVRVRRRASEEKFAEEQKELAGECSLLLTMAKILNEKTADGQRSFFTGLCEKGRGAGTQDNQGRLSRHLRRHY